MSHPQAIDLSGPLSSDRTLKVSRLNLSKFDLRFALACCTGPYVWLCAMLMLSWNVRY